MGTRHWITVAMMVAMATVSGASVAADQASDVVQKVRAALGGEDAIEKVKAIAAKGTFRREMGQRQIEGALTLTIERPDRMHRSEEMEMPGGASVERITALAGDTSWDDTQNRGGMGGGMQMQMVMRGPNGEAANPEAMAHMRTRRMKVELERWMLAFFAASDKPLSAAGVAEAPDGKADVLEFKDERDQPVRLFVDQQTGMPLMITYQDVRPRMMVAGAGQSGPGAQGGRRGGAQGPPPDQEEMRRRMEAERARLQAEGPPPPTTVTLYLADYKEVRGVKLPHRITESIDSKPVMEWTIDKFEVNPKIKADLFEKK